MYFTRDAGFFPRDTEPFSDPSRIANRFAPAVDLHHTHPAHALRQIFIGRPDGDFLDLFVLRREMRGDMELSSENLEEARGNLKEAVEMV